ncbi:hypothetical protein IAD21_06072 [Abditibacteriota bacterium]|nr:hypothetical protein IAD21_06072 [Abditibacteriota bacterium]
MKHLILVSGLVASLSLPVWAQPGGPIQLRNPNRRGGDMGPGGLGGMMPGAPGNGYYGGNPAFNTDVPIAPTTPPSVAMFADGAYLFVLRGDTLFQFDKKTLKLLNSTELPRPIVTNPAPATTQDDVRTQTSPPLRPGPRFNNPPAF